MSLDKKGKTFVISGPSGVGKSTVLKALFEGRDDLYFSVSATTRAPRPGEEHGVNYYFIEPEMFHQWITDGEFLEYAEYVGNFYGTPLPPVREMLAKGQDILFDIDVQGAAQLRKNMPDARFLFILPPSMEELERRLRGRGTETEESIRERLEIARNELAQQDKFTLKLVNDEVDACAARLYDVICQRAGLTR